MQADDLHNEETTASAPPLSRTQWENSKRRYEELLPDGPAWPGDSSYEEYCKKMAQSSHADTARNSYNRPDQSCRKSRSAGSGEGLSDAIANLQGPLPVRRYTSRR